MILTRDQIWGSVPRDPSPGQTAAFHKGVLRFHPGIPSFPDRSFMSAGSVLQMEKRQHGGYPEPSGNVADAAGKPMV